MMTFERRLLLALVGGFPSHLFLGTHQDNIADRDVKGRQSDKRGEKGPSCRLTSEQVLAIRTDNRRQYEIAKDYGIKQQHVSQIKTGKRWSHI